MKALQSTAESTRVLRMSCSSTEVEVEEIYPELPEDVKRGSYIQSYNYKWGQTFASSLAQCCKLYVDVLYLNI